MCTFNYIFIIEVIVKGGIVLDYVILKEVSNLFTIFDLPMYIHRRGRIIETPPNALYFCTTPPLTFSSMLKHLII